MDNKIELILIHCNTQVVFAMLPFKDLVRSSHFSGDNSLISICEDSVVMDVCVGLVRAQQKPWCTLISQPGGGLQDK